MNPHWALRYLGKRWHETEGFGPSSFHCWGLVWYVYQQELAVQLPQFAGIGAHEFLNVQRLITHGVEEAMVSSNGWYPVAQEQADEFTAVAMSKGGRVVHHVGLYSKVDGGRVIHADDPVGVVAEPISNIMARWNRVLFFNYGTRH